MPIMWCGFGGDDGAWAERPQPGVGRGKGRGVTKPPLRKRRKR